LCWDQITFEEKAIVCSSAVSPDPLPALSRSSFQEKTRNISFTDNLSENILPDKRFIAANADDHKAGVVVSCHAFIPSPPPPPFPDPSCESSHRHVALAFSPTSSVLSSPNFNLEDKKHTKVKRLSLKNVKGSKSTDRITKLSTVGSPSPSLSHSSSPSISRFSHVLTSLDPAASGSLYRLFLHPLPLDFSSFRDAGDEFEEIRLQEMSEIVIIGDDGSLEGATLISWILYVLKRHKDSLVCFVFLFFLRYFLFFSSQGSHVCLTPVVSTVRFHMSSHISLLM
jgi:hypothetical protein